MSVLMLLLHRLCLIFQFTWTELLLIHTQHHPLPKKNQHPSTHSPSEHEETLPRQTQTSNSPLLSPLPQTPAKQSSPHTLPTLTHPSEKFIRLANAAERLTNLAKPASEGCRTARQQGSAALGRWIVREMFRRAALESGRRREGDVIDMLGC